jgi:hypothetical protein
MSIITELKASGVDTTSWQAIVSYLATVRTTRDRREGLLRLAAHALNRVPTIEDIEQVRHAPSP